MRGQKILVVDDEVEIVRVLVDYLTEQGYEVTTAHGGIEALAKLDSEKPQIVLLDVRMPGIDGIEVLRRIRASGVPSTDHRFSPTSLARRGLWSVREWPAALRS